MRGSTILCSIILATTTTSAQPPAINYKLAMPEPWTHLFEVEIRYSGLSPAEETLDLALPAWRSGRYIILDFAGSVQEFSVSDGKGKALSWKKTDKQTWRVRKGTSSTVVARYKVYANEFSLRTKGLNDEGAFLDGSSAFMYTEAYRALPLTLTVVPYKNWHVTTGLENVKDSPHTFTAPNYDYLVDCPLFVGNQKDFQFQAEGKQHILSIMGDGNYESETIIEDLKTFVKVNREFWGRLPYEKYVFMLYLTPHGGGGTEHINSTIMGTRPFIFNNPVAYNGFLGLVSHEFFHTWNVKQIRPRGISPYDWTKENYSKELWVAEGTTSYYGSLLMVRAGFTSAEKYLDEIPNQILEERRRPGNRVQSATESSFDAWIKYWKGNENSYNAETDYYDRGADLSLALDLEIRQRSKNKHSLDDVMRALFQRFPWDGSGYTVNDLQSICEEHAASSFRQFFDDYVHGTKSLDWETFLSYAGLNMTAVHDEKAWLGLFARDQGDRTLVRFLMAESPAYNAGLDLNDELIAVNGHRVRASELPGRIAEMRVGDAVRLTIMRNDRLREFHVKLHQNPIPTYSIQKTDKPTDLQKLIFESWLSSPWDRAEGQNKQ